MAANGKGDGISQHYQALMYLGTYLRSIIKTLISTGKLTIPMFDFSIGFGNDVLTTLHYYVIGDPLDLLAVFVPEANTEYLYIALIIFRLYLSGLAFSCFALHLKPGNRFYTLIGALAYTFSGYALFSAIRHPYFTNPMIYLPLILLGIEYIFENKRPYLFILSIFVSVISNFYFFYMLSILMVIYAAFRFFMIYKKSIFKSLLQCFFKFGKFYIIGVLMACAIFIPVVFALFLSNRSDSSTLVGLFYNASYYLRFLSGFISTADAQRWSYIGFSPLALISVILLFMQKGKNKEQKIGFLLLTAFLLFPIFGYIFNGLAYVANRWVWGYGFLVSIILIYSLPKITTLTKKEGLVLCRTMLIYAFLCILFKCARTSANLSMVIILLITVGALLMLTFTYRKGRHFTLTMRGSVMFFLIFGITANSTCLYSPQFKGYVNQFQNRGTAYTTITDTQSKEISSLENDEFFRYEDNDTDKSFCLTNVSMINRARTTSCYFSLINPYVYEYNSAISDRRNEEQDVRGLDGKTMAEALASVKYMIAETSEAGAYLPFGFSLKPVKTVTTANASEYSTSHSVKASGTTEYGYYENKLALPLGYTYSSCILRSDLDSMTAIQKQQAMLQSVTLENATDAVPLNNKIIYTDKDIPYTVELGNNTEYKDGEFKVFANNAYAILRFEGTRKSETYLSFSGIKYSGENPVSLKKESSDWSEMSRNQKVTTLLSGIDWQESPSVSVLVSMGDVSKSFALTTPLRNYHSERGNFDVNLCYHRGARKKIKITFTKAGRYSFDKMNVVCLPMKQYVSDVKALAKDTLQNVKIKSNSVSGTISLDKEKVLCLSIPYSKGWTAYVDGKEVPILKANITYMGIELGAGNHKVKLKYCTPYLKVGIYTSCVGFLCFAAIIVFEETKRRRAKANPAEHTDSR